MTVKDLEYVESILDRSLMQADREHENDIDKCIRDCHGLIALPG